MSQYRVEKFDQNKEQVWDDFIQTESINGTFLQTRRFLNYHPQGRFEDASIMIYNAKNQLIAVSPACTYREDNEKIFYSHKGSTFGGIIIKDKYYDVLKVIEIIEAIELYLKQENYNQIYLKITPDIFALESSDILQYALYYKNYQEYKEINSVIFFDKYKDDILSNFEQGKRTNIHNCIKNGLQLRTLKSDLEIEEFYSILQETLDKYQLKPVHTLSELLDFKNKRLMDECEFFGVFLENKMIAGSMMFYFNNASCAHTQYLCARHEYDTLSPMSYTYYCMITEMKTRNYRTLSWGITSEHMGKELNRGLTRSKTAFGSKNSINRIYYKHL